MPAVAEKNAHLSKLLESVKWHVMGYKGDDADGQPLAHPVSILIICRRGAERFTFGTIHRVMMLTLYTVQYSTVNIIQI